MNRLSAFRHACRRTTTAWLTALLCLAGGAGTSFAQGTGTARNFDHLKTGFALTGAHVQARCESCHLGGTFKGTPRDCASCHVAGMRFARANVVKPANHVPVSPLLGCDSCHNTQTYAGARFNHQGVAPGTCQGCHNGGAASGKPSSHVQTTASCDGCHRTSAWLPAAGFDHAGVVPGSCTACHGAGKASGRPANHVPYQGVAAVATASCDACHKGSFTTWANGRFHANATVVTGCATCHSGSYLGAAGKPNNAAHAGVTGNCESCHKSTATWAGARTDHASFSAATNCAGCHGAGGATAKSATHMPTTANCFACHNVSPAGWTPTKWNHTQVTVTAACASCHSGGYPPADGRPANHIPHQTVAVTAAANCDGCHKGSFTTWANGRLHANYSIGTNCINCHSGSYLGAVGKPNTATHTGVTGGCEGCHRSTTSWSSVTFAHSPANAVGTGTCDTCHNGSTARGKSATHIPVTTGVAKCDSCHRSQASFTASVTMNHSVVTTTQCKLCHNGSYVSQGAQGALAKPTNHIPELQLLNGAALDCNACHTNTTSWGAMTMNHNGSQGNGAGWCKACHQSGTSFLGSMEKKALAHKAKTGQAVTDCSQSGCHRPLGTKGNAYTKWD